MRFVFRCAGLLTVVGAFCAYNYLSSSSSDAYQDSNQISGRRLNDETDNKSDDLEKADPEVLIILYIAGVLYMFLALAIVCDEFFVPALEEMSSDRRMGLSPDVAGATLMAAGGSAPELFTSFVGTFMESDIGFGTIVGSAVFNVLFVIAMCSFLSQDVLTLTWWPLFRDCTYYAISLLVLAFFVGLNSKEEIELYEACILFGMYFGYVLLMKYHDRIYACIVRRCMNMEPERNEDGSIRVLQSGNSKRSVNEDALPAHIQFNRHATFRAGVLKLLQDPYSWMNTAGVGIVSKIAGDVGEVFRKIDINNDGHLSTEELRQMFQELDMPLTDTELAEVIKQVDEDGDGRINEAEFANWYIRSENRMRNKVHHTFKRFDVDNSNTIDRHEVRSLLETLEPRVTEDDVDEALKEMYQHGDTEQISYEEFEQWYMNSLFWEKQRDEIEEEFQSVWESLQPPCEEGVLSLIRWAILFPLVAGLTLTIPDTRRPGLEKYCYLAFFLSICWIGVFSFFMVQWTEVIGNTLGIPEVVMGLTFLAAGTSVPDLLSSVIVAKMGEGDMAVSSSIGSNIFDILIGLPLPWLSYSIIKGNSVTIESKGIARNVLVLLGMIVSIITIIHFQGWKMTNALGTLMMFLYAAFLIQAIIFAYQEDDNE